MMINYYMKIDENNRLVEGHTREPSNSEDFIQIEIEETTLFELMVDGKPLKLVNNELVVDTVQDLINEKEQEIIEAKEYLAETDYVEIKISTANNNDEPDLAETLKLKYHNIRLERENMRVLINELEDEILDLQS